MPDWEREFVKVQDKIENLNRQVDLFSHSFLICLPRNLRIELKAQRLTSSLMKIRLTTKSLISSQISNSLLMKLLPLCLLFPLPASPKQVL
jgi:hypothetical protein